jgi:hypothetical protein
MKIVSLISIIAVLPLAADGQDARQALAGIQAREAVAEIQAMDTYRRAMEFVDEDYPRWVDELIELTEIPAPPFMEHERAAAYLEKLRELGLDEVHRDAEGNVMGIRPGNGNRLVAFAAHLDTVFPEGTDVRVRRRGTQLSAPGIGDDTAGLATLLAVVRAMDAAGVETEADVLFIGNVGEEGIGDLRGMKYLFGEGRYRNENDPGPRKPPVPGDVPGPGRAQLQRVRDRKPGVRVGRRDAETRRTRRSEQSEDHLWRRPDRGWDVGQLDSVRGMDGDRHAIGTLGGTRRVVRRGSPVRRGRGRR